MPPSGPFWTNCRDTIPDVGHAHSAILLATLLVAGHWDCADAQTDSTETPVRTLAMVEGEPVTSDEFQEYIQQSVGANADQAGRDLDRNKLFQDFISETVLVKNARREGITVTLEEAKEYLQQWLGEDQEATPALLEQAHRFLSIQKLLGEKLRDSVQVTLLEMQQYYESNEQEFVIDDQAHVLEILVHDRVSAQEIRNSLRSGDVRAFKETARRRSQGVTANTGGDLGIFQRGELPPDFEDVIFPLKPGEVSPVFRSAHGFHIFMLEEWIIRHNQRFHEVHTAIFDKLTAQKERLAMESYVEGLFRDTSVRLYDPTLQFDSGHDHAQLTR